MQAILGKNKKGHKSYLINQYEIHVQAFLFWQEQRCTQSGSPQFCTSLNRVTSESTLERNGWIFDFESTFYKFGIES